MGRISGCYLKTAANIVDGHVSLIVLVDDLEPLDVHLNLVLGQGDRDLVSRLPVDLQSHLGGQEVVSRRNLFLQNIKQDTVNQIHYRR